MEQKIINIKVTQAGFELVLGAVRQLPHAQVDDLVRELWGQYQEQTPRPGSEASGEPA